MFDIFNRDLESSRKINPPRTTDELVPFTEPKSGIFTTPGTESNWNFTRRIYSFNSTGTEHGVKNVQVKYNA